MRFERGPYGCIGIITLERDEAIVSYQLHALESRLSDSIAGTSLRKSNDRTEICFDVTGLLPLSDYPGLQWTDSEKRRAICRFLRTLPESENHYLDRNNFLTEEEDIFLDPNGKRVVWCYLPAEQEKTNSPPFIERIERLLCHPFFHGVLSELERIRLTHFFQNNRDNELTEFLQELESREESPVRNRDKKKNRLFFLMGIFLLYGFLTVAEYKVHDFPKRLNELFLLSGIVLSGCALLYLRRNKKRKTTAISVEQIPKELFFPSEKEAPNEVNWPPMFLLYVKKDGEDTDLKKAVILTDEFLIGRDSILCDYTLDHPNVSEMHAKIQRKSLRFFLVDLHSQEGTWLRNTKIDPYRQYPLQNGDVVRFGTMAFLFSDGKERQS